VAAIGTVVGLLLFFSHRLVIVGKFFKLNRDNCLIDHLEMAGRWEEASVQCRIMYRNCNLPEILVR